MTEHPEILRLDGALTIKTAADVKERICASLEAASARGVPLHIDIDEEAECDLTTPQMLLSALKTTEQKGIDLILNAPAEGSFPTTLQRGGFLADGAELKDFWIKGLQ
ncbi:STAS domain-containing protein [Rhizobium sp. NRK18]|uniref:STAS domain-containing protein n=1 Tax=Rhizobium sp. NRK18 TaxID=2964667 RepID=UPI0021C42AC5|nr:STAS domain-containing protein [Rhizobium sp. NRK18]MCQ2003294.1 STAS domain-containing protein [Rhizobium sp. NRK18]